MRDLSLTSNPVKKTQKIDVAFVLAMLRSCIENGMVAPGFLGTHGGISVDQSNLLIIMTLIYKPHYRAIVSDRKL
jgi:hypothetical protein